MRPTDSLIPYILASMHPLMHMSLLFTSMLLIFINKDQFYEVNGTIDPVNCKNAYNFTTKYKFEFMFYIMSAHLVSILFHYGHQFFNRFNYQMIANIFLISKVLIYLYSVVMVQQGIMFDECSEITDKSQVMAWLTYEIIAFYFNVIAIIFFLMLAKVKKFKSIKERLGYALNQRKTLDFLTHCQEDIQWWQTWFVQLGLCISGWVMRGDKSVVIGVSATECVIILFMGALCIRQLYFNSKFQFKTNTKVFLALLIVTCFMMLPRYMTLMSDKMIWLAPVVLEIIVSHSIAYIYMGFEYLFWNRKVEQWKQDFLFFSQFQKSDQSETQLRKSLVNWHINADSDEIVNDEKDKNEKKEIKLTASLYTSTFCALMKSNKLKYKLKENEQVDLVFRSCFTFGVQILFSVVLAVFSSFKATLNKPTEVTVSLFFTVLLLHLVCLPSARDGLFMMKYVVVHPEEFNFPVSAYLLGFFAISTMVFAEFVNIASSMSKGNLADAVAGFIGYRIIIDLPQLYMNSLEDFDIKGAVGKLEFKQSRKSIKNSTLIGFRFFNIIYVLANVFYKCIFFYFFPFGASFIPFLKSLGNNF